MTDPDNRRLVCLSLRGRGLCAQLRWDRTVSCSFAPFHLAVGKRHQQFLVTDGSRSLFECTIDSEWRV